MKQTIFWFSIMLVTFALGVATAFVWLSNRIPINQKSETVSLVPEKTNAYAEMPILTYCELANNPEKYDGKIVRLSTKLYQHFHGLKFLDKNCYAEEKEAAVIFNTERQDEIIDKIAQETQTEKLVYWNTPEIIAVGKFTRVKPTRKSDAMVDNAYLRFEIMEVEKASKQ